MNKTLSVQDDTTDKTLSLQDEGGCDHTSNGYSTTCWNKIIHFFFGGRRNVLNRRDCVITTLRRAEKRRDQGIGFTT